MLSSEPKDEKDPPSETRIETKAPDLRRPPSTDSYPSKIDPAEYEKILKARIDWLIKRKKRDGQI